MQITEIDYESGINLFGTRDLYTTPNTNTVTGTIVNGTTAQVETYIIKFDIFKDGVLKSSYQIDPKIRMKSN